MSLAALLLAIGAGALSILAPCVLPLLPIVFASAASRHPLGPFALAIGVVVSFVTVGMTGAALGVAVGMNAEHFRLIGAGLMLAIGTLLTVPAAHTWIATASGPLVNRSHAFIDSRVWSGWSGQLGLGLVLGLVWTPCVGPTLASAMILAARGDELWSSAATMIAFGFGALLPLALLALASRAVTARWRHRLAMSGRRGKMALGAILLLMGTAILTGLDRRIEAILLDLSPQWLIETTTRL